MAKRHASVRSWKSRTGDALAVVDALVWKSQFELDRFDDDDEFKRQLSRYSSGDGEGVKIELARLVPGEGKWMREKALTGPVGQGCKVEEWSDNGARPTLASVIAVRSGRKYARLSSTVFAAT